MVGPGSPLDYPELRFPQSHNENPYTTHDTPSNSPPSSEIMIVHTAQLNNNEEPPYCDKCQVWRPDRTHHCSASGRCILKMDHYCPWFSTCIGFFNHKFFVQFLIYVALYCIILFIVTVTVLYGFLWGERFNEEYLSLNLVILCVLSFAFGISVSLFAGFSIYLILKNLSTIEFQQNRWNRSETTSHGYTYEFTKAQDNNIYDLGAWENWKSTMGNDWYSWCLPININYKSSHHFYKNGINFKINQDIYRKWCENAQLQHQLNQQLQDYKNRLRNSSTAEPSSLNER
ncbi:Palmitoyltransferase PFA3 [Spathaspora sp. JA1]|nr:Palmitoyltransferase PFA3 [Spathaspora sp. JA1]